MRSDFEDQVWERQLGESEAAFRFFVAYREMPRPRSLRTLERTLNKPLTTLGTWSIKHHWVARCEAYDRYLDHQAVQEAIKVRKAMVERHLNLSRTIQTAIARRLERLLRPAADGSFPELEKLTPASMASLTEVAVKLERLSLGETTENVGYRDQPELPGGPAPLAESVLASPEAIRLAAELARSLGGGPSSANGHPDDPGSLNLTRDVGKLL